MTLPNPQGDWALFLDFDGTLVELAERPESVISGNEVQDLLSGLQVHLGGAVAVVTGRAIEECDQFLGGIVRVIAGHHGQELRTPDGVVHHQDIPHDALADIRGELDAFVGQHRSLLLEVKGRALALHFRQAPELEHACDEITKRLAGRFPDELVVLNGKMVREIKASGHDKGDAVAQLMEMPPFKGRRPVYAGDDVTDEDAFAVVNRLDGVSIKVGEGDTGARHRVATVAELRAWLRQIQNPDANAVAAS